MKRDMELVRAIMQAVNGQTDLKHRVIMLDGYDPLAVQRHVEMMFDAGLLEGLPHKSGSSGQRIIHVTDMSWAGHDFLAATQNSGVWHKMKSTFASEAMEVPFQLMKDVGIALIKQQVKSALGLSDL